MIDLRIDDRGISGRVATVVVDNAAKLNCMGREVRAGLLRAFAELGRDDRLRAVVLTGAGERAFVGGADLRELAALRDAAEAEAFITEVHRCCDAVRRCPVPVVARVRGYVLGAGLELAACCDIRVASDDSQFGMPEVRIGLPSVIEAALLPRLIGWGRTRYLVLTGDTVPVSEARDWGLFERIVPAAELDAAVERIVAAIVAAGPQAFDAIVDLPQGGENENRRRHLLRAQAANQREPVHLGEHAIDDQHVVATDARHVIAGQTVIGGVRDVPGFAECFDEVLGRLGVVFDDQNSHGRHIDAHSFSNEQAGSLTRPAASSLERSEEASRP